MSSPSPALRVPRVPASVDDAWHPELFRLRDGSLVTTRATRKDDEASLRAFLNGLCPEARRMRFFSGGVDTASAAHLAADTTVGHYGLVARDEAGVIVGHAIYVQLDPKRAEVAVEVADQLHGRGLGTMLIERLALVAERRGITHFVAEVLCENRTMLDVFREGFDARVLRHEGPEEQVEFLTSGWRLAHERFDASTGGPGETLDVQQGDRGV